MKFAAYFHTICRFSGLLGRAMGLALVLVLACWGGLVWADSERTTEPLPVILPLSSDPASFLGADGPSAPALTDTLGFSYDLAPWVGSRMTATITVTPTTPPLVEKSDNQLGRYLLVNQDRQTMSVYENGVAVRVIPVSTGRPIQNSLTPAWNGSVGEYWGRGRFASGLQADYIWYLFPGKWGSILIHSVPYIQTDNAKVYDRLEALGSEPVSLGCVRISPEDAAWLKDWDPTDVPITITAWSGPIGPPDPLLPQVSDN